MLPRLVSSMAARGSEARRRQLQRLVARQQPLIGRPRDTTGRIEAHEASTEDLRDARLTAGYERARDLRVGTPLSEGWPRRSFVHRCNEIPAGEVKRAPARVAHPTRAAGGWNASAYPGGGGASAPMPC